MTNEVTLSVPLALQKLIVANNQLLKQYQQKLVNEIEEANYQMMQMLRLEVEDGWQLDMERMVYVRPADEEEPSTEDEQQETE